MVRRTVAWITPLVSELQSFCQHHEEGRGYCAAVGMLEHLRHDWVGVPDMVLPAPEYEDRDREELALMIVRDVGEVAAILLPDDLAEARLAWARANLITDLEQYESLVEDPA